MRAAAVPLPPLARPVPGGLLWLALLLTGVIQGTLMLSRAFLNSDGAGTLLFLASAYRVHPFDPWDDRWYGGIPLTGLPPLVPELLAVFEGRLSPAGAYGLVQLLATLLLVAGTHRASRALGLRADAAGLAAALAGTSAALSVQLSVFGHLGAVLGAALTLHALPAIRAALAGSEAGGAARRRWWAAALTLLAAGLACPGAALPLGALVVLALAGLDMPSAAQRSRTLRLALLCALPGLLMLAATHAWSGPPGVNLRAPGVPAAAGRDLLVTLLLPLGGVLWALPGLWRRARPGAQPTGAVALARMGAGLALVAALAVLGGALGHPGLVTTPPETLLFFGLLLALPLAGQVGLGLRVGAPPGARVGLMVLVGVTALYSVGLHPLGTRRALEPARIDMQPILNFIGKDEHWRYRFLTVGFGRQLALMSAQTRAGTPSGLLHLPPELPRVLDSAQHLAALPERADVPGQGSLEALLTHPERTHLKFVYAKSTLYDPLLHLCGWHPIGAVENGVMVWEREDIPPVPARPARGDLPFPLGVAWGTLPLLALLLAGGALIRAGNHHGRPSSESDAPAAEPRRPVAALLLGTALLLAGMTLRARLVPGQVAATATVAGARLPPAGGGLHGEYARLDSVRPLTRSGDTVPVLRRWWTPLGSWADRASVTLRPAGLGWAATPPDAATSVQTAAPTDPPQAGVAFYRSPRRLTVDTTSAGDVLDRPVVQVLATRLVRAPDGRLTVVGELRNVDARPADTTITVVLRGSGGRALTRENVGRRTLHKLRPGERTPFQVTFPPAALPPGTPLKDLSVEIAARAVVTGREQERPLMARSRVRAGRLEVVVTNVGTRTVGTAQALVTLLDARGAAWVQEVVGMDALPPGAEWAFSVPATPPAGLSTLTALPAPPSQAAPPPGPVPGTFARPGGSYRVTLNAFIPQEHP